MINFSRTISPVVVKSIAKLGNTITVLIFVLCRVDGELQIKVADFGLTRDIYATDYYRQSHHGRVPVKWMSLESLHDKISNEKTDVVRRTIADLQGNVTSH